VKGWQRHALSRRPAPIFTLALRRRILVDVVLLVAVTLASIALALGIGWGLLNGVLNGMAQGSPMRRRAEKG
jgi:hypothetical protein